MPTSEKIAAAIETIDHLVAWLQDTGLSASAIAQFKFNSLASMYPELKGVAETAKQLIGAASPLTEGKDSGLKTCGSNACLARVLGQNKGFCLSWLIVNKRGEVTVFRGLLRIEIDLVSSSISKVFAQQGVQ